jgi:hypothetical protein
MKNYFTVWSNPVLPRSIWTNWWLVRCFGKRAAGTSKSAPIPWDFHYSFQSNSSPKTSPHGPILPYISRQPTLFLQCPLNRKHHNPPGKHLKLSNKARSQTKCSMSTWFKWTPISPPLPLKPPNTYITCTDGWVTLTVECTTCGTSPSISTIGTLTVETTSRPPSFHTQRISDGSHSPQHHMRGLSPRLAIEIPASTPPTSIVFFHCKFLIPFFSFFLLYQVLGTMLDLSLGGGGYSELVSAWYLVVIDCCNIFRNTNFSGWIL